MVRNHALSGRARRGQNAWSLRFLVGHLLQTSTSTKLPSSGHLQSAAGRPIPHEEERPETTGADWSGHRPSLVMKGSPVRVRASALVASQAGPSRFALASRETESRPPSQSVLTRRKEMLRADSRSALSTRISRHPPTRSSAEMSVVPSPHLMPCAQKRADDIGLTLRRHNCQTRPGTRTGTAPNADRRRA